MKLGSSQANTSKYFTFQVTTVSKIIKESLNMLKEWEKTVTL